MRSRGTGATPDYGRVPSCCSLRASRRSAVGEPGPSRIFGPHGPPILPGPSAPAEPPAVPDLRPSRGSDSRRRRRTSGSSRAFGPQDLRTSSRSHDRSGSLTTPVLTDRMAAEAAATSAAHTGCMIADAITPPDCTGPNGIPFTGRIPNAILRSSESSPPRRLMTPEAHAITFTGRHVILIHRAVGCI